MRSTQELIDHLDSLLRTQVYNGATPNLVPIHQGTIREIIQRLRERALPTQVERAVNGELGTHEEKAP